jgi:hypothetical protein
MGCVGEVVTSPHHHLAKIFSNLVDIHIPASASKDACSLDYYKWEKLQS